MNYKLGDIVTIGNEDYKIVPPRNLTALCDGCDFKQGVCQAPDYVPCACPSRTYKKVTDQYRTRGKKSFRNFIKYIINN